MREKLNDNPLAQAAVVGVLLLVAVFFLMSTMGRGGAEEEAGSEGAPAAATPEGAPAVAGEATLAGAASTTSTVPPAALAETAPPPPRRVTDAFKRNQIVVLLFVRKGGIDDAMVAPVVKSLSLFKDVASFVVPADRIYRYAAITEGVEVERVPALVVVRPKKLAGDNPSASVSYGYQSPASVVQAVLDAGYKGPTLDYHP
jgi:hypothetical protein